MLDSAALAYALLLGMVAAFNPCGFALLPAYITVIVTGTAGADAPRAIAARRAVLFALAMTTGFLTVFLAFGLVFALVSLGLQATVLPVISYVTIVLGVLVTVLGMFMAIRGELRGPGLSALVRGSHAPGRTFFSQALYGVSFALASLSCTIGLFLVVVAGALDASGPVDAVAPFIAYGLGMGTAVVLVSLLSALVGSSAAVALRRHTPLLMRIGGVLMVFAGVYVTLFGLAEVLPRYGIYALDPLVRVTTGWQFSLTQAIQGWGTPVLLALAAVAVAGVAWVFVAARRAERVS
jgi:cytochrome c biogenesis protein CcdA